MKVQYKGPLISDTCIPGEGKSEGITPETSSCVQASEDKWLIFFGTSDPRGHDTSRSIFYQIRKNSPDGEVIKEDIIERARSGWDPLNMGHDLWKVNAIPKLFGVPKGALSNGKPIPSANHFVAKWFTRAGMEKDGLLVNPWHPDEWPADIKIMDYDTSCQGLEWMQFRLNDAEDDIEIISPTKQLRQKGYENSLALSSIGPSNESNTWVRMHHGFGNAAPYNKDYSEWIEVCQFEDKMAAIRYVFNPDCGLYEWIETGKTHQRPGMDWSEASINRINNEWVISIRAYNQEGQTTWYKTSDPFESFGDNIDIKCAYSPRISYVCADGVLRLFSNEKDFSPLAGRNPLNCFDVDPKDFSYSNKQVVLDCRKEGLPFYIPFADHAMLYPYAGGKKQIITFRVITHKQTMRQADDPEVTAEELEKSGVHYSELIYDQECPQLWEF